MPQDPPAQKPTAALTSRAAVVAALLLFVAIVVAAVVLQGRAGDEPAEPAAAAPAGPVHEGMVAPDFTLTSLDGENVSLSDYAGRPLLVNFWASWCPPCRDEFPALARAHEAHADDGFEILGVTYNDQPDLARAFVEDSGGAWPILYDPDHVAWDAFSPVGPPTSYFVDAEGVVQRVHIGAVNDEQLASHLAAIGL